MTQISEMEGGDKIEQDRREGGGIAVGEERRRSSNGMHEYKKNIYRAIAPSGSPAGKAIQLV